MQRPNELIAIVKASKILLKNLFIAMNFNTFKYIYTCSNFGTLLHSNKSFTMLREAAIAALGLASASAFKIADNVLQNRDGAHAHEHADSGYGAPAATYEEPAASYGAPAPSYSEPETGYGAPAPSYGYEEEPLPDLTPIIVGILVLTGLSLLFPTFVSLTTVRRKRHAEDEHDTQTDVIERVNEIYTAVVQSEECMEKIACEVGALAGDVGLTQSPALK